MTPLSISTPTDWSTRVKQIAKLWRKASSQDRAPYVVRSLIPLFSLVCAQSNVKSSHFRLYVKHLSQLSVSL